MGDDRIRHLTLRPGTPVLRREPGLLQVGLSHPASSAPAAVALPDSVQVRDLLDQLERFEGLPLDRDAPPGPLVDVLERLEAAGHVVDRARPDAVGPGPGLARSQFGSDARRRSTLRAQATVAVRVEPGADTARDHSLEAVVDDLLREAGLRRDDAAPLAATAHLVVAGGVLDREVTDALVQAALPHLVVSGAATGLRIGPFVDPGRTACVRCVDAHESLSDPRRPLLLCQAAARDRRSPPPRDRAMDLMALAWAVRDLTRFVEGDQPATWSATADVGPREGPLLTSWGRHPECGCAWDDWLIWP